GGLALCLHADGLLEVVEIVDAEPVRRELEAWQRFADVAHGTLATRRFGVVALAPTGGIGTARLDRELELRRAVLAQDGLDPSLHGRTFGPGLGQPHELAGTVGIHDEAQRAANRRRELRRSHPLGRAVQEEVER